MPSLATAKWLGDCKNEHLRGSTMTNRGRRPAEVALHESEARMRAITDSAKDATLMMEPKGLVTYWNSVAERIC